MKGHVVTRQYVRTTPADADRCESATSKAAGRGRCSFAATATRTDGRRVCVRHTDAFRERASNGQWSQEDKGGRPRPGSLRLPVDGGRPFPLTARGFRASARWQPRREAVSIDLVIDDRDFRVELPLREFLAAQEAQ